VIDSKTNAADGSVTFDAIKYTQDDIYEVDPETGVYSGADTKTLTYTISEVIPEGAKDNGDGTFLYNGYTYDGTVYTVAVVLTDNGDGTITAVVAGSEGETGTTEAGTEGGTTEGGEEAAATDYVFTNAYDAAGTLKLDAEKTFKNGTIKGGEFTFELKDADGKVLQSKKNDAAGNVSFDLITYKMEDLAKSPFKYTVSEVIGDKEDVKYDNTVYTVTVTLKDNDDGTLSVEKKIDNGGKLKFVNEQLNVNTSITLGGVKVLKGQTLKANQFKFVLTDENGKKISTARNDADGNFTFKEINYKLSDLNGEAERVYTYKVSEVKGSKSNIVYDTKVYTVKVTVTDNGDGTMTATADLDNKSIKFVNKTVTKKTTTSKKSGTKKSGTKRKGAGTGDNSPLGLLFGGLVIGAAGIAALLWARKKRNKKS
jgi:pilin isopeptide linkage protein/LPXTG-motif cell wall-anchored protein